MFKSIFPQWNEESVPISSTLKNIYIDDIKISSSPSHTVTPIKIKSLQQKEKNLNKNNSKNTKNLIYNNNLLTSSTQTSSQIQTNKNKKNFQNNEKIEVINNKENSIQSKRKIKNKFMTMTKQEQQKRKIIKEKLAEQEQDYESLPTNSFLINAGAGTLAGISEHCVMYPIDSLKTRLQILSPVKNMHTLAKSAATPATKYYKYYLRDLWKGVGSMFIGAGPAHAVYYGSYEYAKKWLKIEEGHSHLKEAYAGAFATVLSEAVLNPFDVIKQRMQVQSQHQISKSMMQTGMNIFKKEGLSAFYVSLPTTLIMNIPFNSIHFIIYEYYRKKLNPSGKYDPKSHIISGALAGGIASIITNPLDVSKTLLQLRGTSADASIINTNGLWQATKIIYQRHGLKGFTKGMVPRVLYNMPSTAISWTAYEFCKFFLIKQGQKAHSMKLLKESEVD